jgi:alpha-glucosidase
MEKSSMSKYSPFIFALLLALIGSAAAQPKPVDAEGHQWWQHAVFYEIYPRSFADSNNDGIGDLKGITSKMNYLRDLGVDAIWITPCFPSPQVDFGYDVSDYENIDPMYGTLADFDQMVAEGKKQKISIIFDFVVNHSSDQHPWFTDSKSSRTAAHRDWYMWHDGKAPGNQPPNNWTSEFGGSAWKLDPKTGQYYYHFFYAEQPDLNWHNPAVKNAMFDVTRWWYDRGVSGFRLDAVDTLFEDPQLRDNPVQPGKNAYGDPIQDRIYNTKLPEVHDVLRGLRQVADKSGAVLIGETWTKDVSELRQYYGDHSDELQMPMDLMFTHLKFSAPIFREHVAAVDGSGGWPVYVISNHDIVRSYDRYGDGQHNDQIAKVMAALYLTLRGTPIMYYGEEIGMKTTPPTRKEDVKDPIGRTGWPKEKGRDGERTPMQWSTDTNAGFSTKTPWLPVPPTYKTYNVAAEEKDPDSILNLYKKLLALRHTNEALLDGSYTALNQNDANVMSYLRSYKGKAVLVALNISSSPQKVTFNLADQGFASGSLKRLIATSQSSAKGGQVSLEPFGVFIAEVSKQGSGQ